MINEAVDITDEFLSLRKTIKIALEKITNDTLEFIDKHKLMRTGGKTTPTGYHDARLTNIIVNQNCETLRSILSSRFPDTKFIIDNEEKVSSGYSNNMLSLSIPYSAIENSVKLISQKILDLMTKNRGIGITRLLDNPALQNAIADILMNKYFNEIASDIIHEIAQHKQTSKQFSAGKFATPSKTAELQKITAIATKKAYEIMQNLVPENIQLDSIDDIQYLDLNDTRMCLEKITGLLSRLNNHIKMSDKVDEKNYKKYLTDIFKTIMFFANHLEKHQKRLSKGYRTESKNSLKKACWKGYTAVGVKKKNGKTVPNCVPESTQLDEKSAAWQRKEGKNKKGGLNKKGVASYRKEHPGSKLQTAVTTPPSKLKKGSKPYKRRKSFCARMSGMPGPMKDKHGKPTRKALSLRKWNC